MKTKLYVTRVDRFGIAVDQAGTEHFIAPPDMNSSRLYHGAAIMATVKPSPIRGKMPNATEVELLCDTQ
jgi:hypothetical protein